MLLLALSISGCGATHYLTLSDSARERLENDCPPPQQPPPEWLTYEDDQEAERRAVEAPVLRANDIAYKKCRSAVRYTLDEHYRNAKP